ncbi:hypothetical protein QFC22_004642 [Naganishia vaughanmartiniae]|uniref:Uncharacterized protein n=1 Tax=Naganishia vaughanmartiniae TaxID=1424756 RepID=A0ACC2X0T1_9TREE|nr:hypothetical protein QFC22_004642 [Naganishia vaughanmartiniae]
MLSFITLLTYSAVAVLASPLKRAPASYNIHASGAPNLCLGTTTTPANGVVLYNIPCTTAPGSPKAYLDFTFEPTIPGVFQLTGTNFCIDAGLNFNELKLWTCYPGAPQQNWVYTGSQDRHIALYQQTECISYSGGGCGNGGCAPGSVGCNPDAVQKWDLTPSGGGPPPVTTGQEIRFGTQCLGLTAATATDGTLVSTGPCLAANDKAKSTQLWNVAAKGSDGLIKLAGTNYCLDAGSPPLANGRLAKTWTCYQGLKQQTWFHTYDDHLAITGDGTLRSSCLPILFEA